MPAGGEMSGLTAHFLFGEFLPSLGQLFFAAFGISFWILALISNEFPGWLSVLGLALTVGPDCQGAWATMAADLDAIRSAAARVAASHGLDVVDLELTGPSKDRVLTVYLEKNAAGREQLKAAIAAGENEALPERLREGTLSVEQLSGITHEDCAEFSRDFGVLLDVEDLVPGTEYTLEASSPGLDRKLSRPEDFERFSGCLVKVQTFEPIAGNRHWHGRLKAGGTGSVIALGVITLDLDAVKQNSKSRKTGARTVEIALRNIEKARLVPEI
jgi:ribosome maturation factor RimP